MQQAICVRDAIHTENNMLQVHKPISDVEVAYNLSSAAYRYDALSEQSRASKQRPHSQCRGAGDGLAGAMPANHTTSGEQDSAT
jgi:hypothetical protein